MQKKLSNQQTVIKGKLPIILLSVITLLSGIVGYIFSIIATSSVFIFDNYPINITVIFSIVCKLICAALVVLAPVILLAYVVILCKKFQPRFFASAVYVICSALAVFSLLPYAFSAIYSMIVYGSPLPQISYIISIILQFLIAISFLILAIIGLFKLKNKIIPAVAILTIILLQLILTPMLMTGAGMGFVIAIILITISIMALYIALLVLVLSSEAIPISNSESEQ